MDEGRFWEMIDKLDWRHEGDDDLVTKPVVAALAVMPLEEIETFEEILAQKLRALDGRAWAREIGSGWWGGEPPVSVDAFLYARCVVVANGQEFYDSVLADPTLMPKDSEFEVLITIGSSAWKAKTGEEPSFRTSVSYETYSNQAGWPPAPPEPERIAPRGGVRDGGESYDRGKRATRRVIRSLVTGELHDAVLGDHLGLSSKRLVMTPGSGVLPPREPDDQTEPWIAAVNLWGRSPGSEPEPLGLVARIELTRISPREVRGRLVEVMGSDRRP